MCFCSSSDSQPFPADLKIIIDQYSSPYCLLIWRSRKFATWTWLLQCQWGSNHHATLRSQSHFRLWDALAYNIVAVVCFVLIKYPEIMIAWGKLLHWPLVLSRWTSAQPFPEGESGVKKLLAKSSSSPSPDTCSLFISFSFLFLLFQIIFRISYCTGLWMKMFLTQWWTMY